MILHVTELEVCGLYSLRVAFNDGTRKRVNLRPILWGPVFEPLHDPEYFAQVQLDKIFGVPVWPNDADLAPEALYDLEPEEEPV